jgi:hypothetical protein
MRGRILKQFLNFHAANHPIMNMKKCFYSLLLLVLAAAPLAARHIVGGSIRYWPNVGGTLNWNFEMTVYRDCHSSGAGFDDPASIAIYREDTPGSYTLHNTFSVGLSSVEALNILPPSACPMTDDSVCLEKGRYLFSADIPDDGLNYVVVYQRCCRGETIVNLFDAGNSGFSLFIELSSLARSLQNTAPQLDSFPLPALCNNQPGYIQFYSSDADGDDVVLDFCPILSGGGPILTAPGLESCAGALPTPPCPPPFAELSFADTTFSFSKPLGNFADALLNPEAGVWSVFPHHAGRYVYAVWLRDYRNGQLLSTVRSEFQLNVLDSQASSTGTSAVPGLRVWPNPNDGQISIELPVPAASNLFLKICDLTGRIVFEKRAEFGIEKQTIQAEKLPPGLYFLQVVSEGKLLAVEKFVKE